MAEGPTLPADWKVKHADDKCKWFDAQNLKYNDVPLSKCYTNTDAIFTAVHSTSRALIAIQDQLTPMKPSEELKSAFDNLSRKFTATTNKFLELLRRDVMFLMERGFYWESARPITEQVVARAGDFDGDNYPTVSIFSRNWVAKSNIRFRTYG